MLLLLAFGLCFSYIPVAFLFSLFFENRIPKLNINSARSVGIMALYTGFIFWLSFVVLEPEFGNRILHAFGGGFFSFLVCFRVVRDFKITISKTRFLVFAALVVTALGVMNELIEFFVQAHGTLIFATTISDTWLDLMSNSIGIIIGALCFVPFIQKNPR